MVIPASKRLAPTKGITIMSNLITCQDWTYGADYATAYAPTNDPRVVAFIRHDDDATFERCLDGDAINPTFLVDGDSVQHIGGYDTDKELAQRVVEARDRFRYAAGYRYSGLSIAHIMKSEVMLARWAWIFHGTVVSRGDYGYQSAYDVLVLDTPAYREHVGITETTREKATERVNATAREVSEIADGNVYGIGYLVNEARVLADEPIDVEDGDWIETVECWGYVGEDYAKSEAASFTDGTPELAEMLALPKGA